MKRPSFQFYPSDWLRDTALRTCSISARGLWMDMICYMHEGNPYGYLKVKDKVILPANLGAMVGLTLQETEGYLKELFDAGVYEIDENGAIFSKRMVKDEKTRQARANGGKLGGNPKLVNGKVNLPVNHNVNVKVQNKDKQKPTPSSSSSTSIDNIYLQNANDVAVAEFSSESLVNESLANTISENCDDGFCHENPSLSLAKEPLIGNDLSLSTAVKTLDQSPMANVLCMVVSRPNMNVVNEEVALEDENATSLQNALFDEEPVIDVNALTEPACKSAALATPRSTKTVVLLDGRTVEIADSADKAGKGKTRRSKQSAEQSAGELLINSDSQKEKKAGKSKIEADADKEFRRALWHTYEAEYYNKYGVYPVTNCKNNSLIKRFSETLPKEDAIDVIRHYFTQKDRFYLVNKHPLTVLLKDAEKLRTEMLTGDTMTMTRATAIEKSTESNTAKCNRILMEAGLY